jgi:hypothetical protein
MILHVSIYPYTKCNIDLFPRPFIGMQVRMFGKLFNLDLIFEKKKDGSHKETIGATLKFCFSFFWDLNPLNKRV